MHTNPFQLLTKRYFSPFFATQFFGAFNDNVLKNALVVLITFQSIKTESEINLLVNICAGLFILPFFLFSALAGQAADKWEKSQVIRLIKVCEILIMLCAAFGFYTQNVTFLMIMLFLAGAQSTFFGPLKFGILPQHLPKPELLAGNALVEMGTFISILLGIIAGSMLIDIPKTGALWVGGVLVAVALLGWWVSRLIPHAPANDPSLRFSFNIFSQSWNILNITRSNDTVFKSVLGISWFWFFGATLLTQMPNYTKQVLNGDNQVYVLLLAVFSVGVGVGSVMCERLSGKVVEIGLVPIGSFFLTLFGVDLYFATNAYTAPLAMIDSGLFNVSTFWMQSGAWRILLDVLLMGAFGGFFIVPLYALVQERSEPKIRARVIAGLNILNALFMVLSAVYAVALLSFGLSIQALFLITALLNVLVAIYIYTLVPEFVMRCIVWCLVNTLYRAKKINLENIPSEGAAVLVCNHVSFVDALIIASCSRRPPRFVMDSAIFKTPVLGFVFRTARAIPIASYKKDPELLEKAYHDISDALKNEELVCIFPEGKLTSDGEVDQFRAGIERIIATDPVPVVPMAIKGLWGSFFSRESGRAMTRPFKRFWSKIELVVGDAISPEHVSADVLRYAVLALLDENKTN